MLIFCIEFYLISECINMLFLFIDWLNTVNVHNREILIDALDNRPKGTPLITVCNHHSCLDDPMLWGK